MHYQRKRQAKASGRGRRMAQARWKLDRARRDALAAVDPVRLGNIVRRIVVIDRETVVREAVIYGFDSARSARRKIKFALTP